MGGWAVLDTPAWQRHLHLCLNRPTLVAIGVFDGVHLGHQHLISSMKARAQELGYLAGVLTLYPHPQQVLDSSFQAAYLITLDERMYRLRQQGVDWVGLLAFDQEVANTPAPSFVRALLACLQFRELWAGPDFALGRDREGSLSCLEEIGRSLGFRVSRVEPLQVGGLPVSSTRVRQALLAGDMSQAAMLLGRPPSLTGEVMAGFQRGRGIGFPTANLRVDEDILVPANGVYAAYAAVSYKRYPALVNIGTRPTFDNGARSIEAYLLDVSVDLYGQRMTLELQERLRGEIRFPDPQALAAQIQEDVRRARHLLMGKDPVQSNIELGRRGG